MENEAWPEVPTVYIDRNPGGGTYTVKPVVNGREKDEKNAAFTLPDKAPEGYINIALDKPADGVTPSGEAYTYSPNDASGTRTATANTRSS